ncbi:MAG TPA: glycoside hydrolase family 3 N-terminal domain-containing protein, partial [Lacipirellulaceae bacterium]|nr:glycoside hydrolase family 3 N-terminal domain-containing protein [Lacipirellulaceae bacterium]
NIARAVELTRAYVVAAETAGLRTTAKHFPGHGSTEKDSHDSLPSVPRTRAELEACELVPFRAAIDAGCSMVMTAHVSYPTLDPSGAPATLSPMILQQLLRDEMGFGGVICSDSLLMAGARDLFAREEEMALAVLNAGVDMLLDFIEPARVIDYLCDCVEVGKLDVQRVEEAAWRVRALKERVFGNVRKDGNGRVMHNSVSRPSLAERVAAGAVDVVDRRDSGLLPFHPDVPLVAILLKPFETPIEPPEQPLGAAIRERFRNAKYVQLGPNADADSYQATYDLARGARQLLIAVIVRPAAWYAFGLRKEQVEFVRQLTGERHDVVLASLGVKFVLEDYPGAGVRICTYSDVPVSQQALAEFLVKSGGTP